MSFCCFILHTSKQEFLLHIYSMKPVFLLIICFLLSIYPSFHIWNQIRQAQVSFNRPSSKSYILWIEDELHEDIVYIKCIKS